MIVSKSKQILKAFMKLELSESKVTSLPTYRETLRAEKNGRYFDFKHLRLYISL